MPTVYLPASSSVEPLWEARQPAQRLTHCTRLHLLVRTGRIPPAAHRRRRALRPRSDRSLAAAGWLEFSGYPNGSASQEGAMTPAPVVHQLPCPVCCKEGALVLVTMPSGRQTAPIALCGCNISGARIPGDEQGKECVQQEEANEGHGKQR